MLNDLTIRPVALADYDQWLPLWKGYNAFYGRSGVTALEAQEDHANNMETIF